MASLALLGCSSPSGPSAPIGPSGPPCSEPRFAEGRLSIQCAQLVDAEGRVVFMHGVNARVEGIFDVTFEDGRAPLEQIPALSLEDTKRMRAMGFNSLRLPINWSGLEPHDGEGFSEAYLDKVEAAVDLAAQAGLRVLLDFHQDAYSKEIGEDGAPLWAIIPPPVMLLEGPLTDLDKRRTSSQVLQAFDTFFGDTADGVMLRARFAAAVAHVAARFKGNSAVLGVELYNEPIAQDSAHLHAFHDAVIAAVREVDPGLVLLFEPDTQRNLFDYAPLAKRDPWPGTAYAPHVYTLAFGGSPEERASMTRDTLDFSNEAARNEADSWAAPLVITEFGYDPKGIQAENYLRWQTELQDQYLASGYFWVWKEQSQGSWGMFEWSAADGSWMERDNVRKALSRVAAEAIAGFPTALGYDSEARRFEVKFTGDPEVTAPSLIFVPDASDFAPSFDVTCDGAAVTASRDPLSGVIEVDCGGPGAHSIVVTGR